MGRERRRADKKPSGGPHGVLTALVLAALLLLPLGVITLLFLQGEEQWEDGPYSQGEVVLEAAEEQAQEQYALAPTDDMGRDYVEDTVFLGDSNMVRLLNYGLLEEDQVLAREKIGIRDVDTLDFVGADPYDEGGDTILEALEQMQPQRILMTFGTNDIGEMSPYEFVAEYRQVLHQIQSVCDADIIVNAIPPVRRDCIYQKLTNEKLKTYNYMLRSLCEEEGVPFLDSTEVLANLSGWSLPPYTVKDGVHFTERGGKVLLQYLRTHAYWPDDAAKDI